MRTRPRADGAQSTSFAYGRSALWLCVLAKIGATKLHKPFDFTRNPSDSSRHDADLAGHRPAPGEPLTGAVAGGSGMVPAPAWKTSIMTSLSDTQRVLLSGAAQRDNGSLLPLPASLRPGGGVAKAINALLTRGFAEERETNDAAAVRRTEGNMCYGIFVTDTGMAAIGIEVANDVDSASTAPVALPAPAGAPRPSKISEVVVLLSRGDGATLPELIAATGWLPHTTRAALTGLRKKGHEIARSKRDGATCYRIVVAA